MIKVSKIAYQGGLRFFNFLDLKLYLALRRQRPAEASAGGLSSSRLEALLRSRRCVARMLILSTQNRLQSVLSLCHGASVTKISVAPPQNMQSDGIATLLQVLSIFVLRFFSFLIDKLLCNNQLLHGFKLINNTLEKLWSMISLSK